MDEKTLSHEVSHHELSPVSSQDKLDVLHVTTERPYGEIRFWGTYAAVCLGALACYGGFVMPATTLSLIDADIGPSKSIYWVVLAWTLSLSVGYTLVGRLSDIFGRRWFFIGASLMATVGCVIGATANNVNQLIGAEVLIGLATAAQLSFNYIITELVPFRDRFYILSGIFLTAFPFSGLGPWIARLLVVHTTAGWRWEFYMTLIVNGVSTILYAIFYHPPNFDELHGRKRTRWQEVKDIDIGGLILFCAGLILFLTGLEWGSSGYGWSSPRVIATLVVGLGLTVIFVIYECYMPLTRPLVPMHLFKSREYVALTLVSGVGGMLYYSLNVLFPTMVATLFTTDIIEVGKLACALGGGVAAGQFSASLWATPGGLFKPKLIFCVVGCTGFAAGLAGAKTEGTAVGLAVMCAFFIGALESLAGVAVTFIIKDQTELGAAVGVYGSIRSVLGTLATAIFVTILTDRVTHNTVHHVVPALVEAGLPPKDVETFLTTLTYDPADIAKVPGFSEKILEVAIVTIQAAYSNAFTLLFLVTLAFGGLSIIASLFAPNIEKLYDGKVMRRLHRSGAVRGEPEKEIPA